MPSATVTDLRRAPRRRAPDPADALLQEYLPNAHAIARRFYRHGEPLDDLVQVALEGLLLAIKRFDPERGTPFGAYANAIMIGTVKRHFRDRGWAIRVPRRVHDLAGPIARATTMLEQDLGRTPSNAEIADLLAIDVGDVDEVLAATQARSTQSIDADDGTSRQLSDPLDVVARADDRHSLQQAIKGMSAERQYVLVRYFEDELTQAEIAAEIGRSQMHVSRVINRSVAELRSAMT